jgi:hypothetical protein
MMDSVHKPNVSECYTPLSEPFRVYCPLQTTKAINVQDQTPNTYEEVIILNFLALFSSQFMQLCDSSSLAIGFIGQGLAYAHVFSL